MQALLKNFVLAADEVWNLQHAKTAEARLFRTFSNKGHYNRPNQDLTRQGVYAVTPAGEFLGSWNTRSLPSVRKNLSKALAVWEGLEAGERLPQGPLEPGFRWSGKYPEDGLALLVYTRDLPRESEAAGPAEGTDASSETSHQEVLKTWRTRAWNQDRFWARASELAPVLEGKPLPKEFVQRLLRLHGRDNVRGQTTGYRSRDVKIAELNLEWTERSAKRVAVQFSGEGFVQETGNWAIHDRHAESAKQTRSFQGKLRGHAVWEAGRCTEFELVWTGMRLGATKYNGRHDDPGPAPMAVVFVLAPAEDRVPPSLVWQYGWK